MTYFELENSAKPNKKPNKTDLVYLFLDIVIKINKISNFIQICTMKNSY